MRINKTLNLVMSIILTMTFFALVSTSASAVTYAQPGDHCGATGDLDCRSDLVCMYNTCLAKPLASCTTTADCAGTATNLMSCYNGQCFGRHGYLCGDVREDPVCLHDPADSFHCDISNPGYHYCEHDHTEYCGDNILNLAETCELPNSINNDYCRQNDTTCLGTKLGTRDDYGNCDASCGCVEDSFNYICAKGQCGATCAVNADCAPKCVGNIYNSGGTCGADSCACSYSSENCDLKDGWYNTTSTQWISTGQCTEKEQKQQKYRDYSCALPNGCTYVETDSKWVDTGNTRNKPNGTTCNDGLFCTTPDVCTNGQCGGTQKDCSDNLFCTINERCDEVNDRCTSDQKSCSAFNISSIATCDNNPDSIHFTWDFRSWFTSVCDENNDKCTTGNENITHSCSKDKCGAVCENDADCNDGNVHTIDTCDVASCTCKHEEQPYCGDNILNVSLGETCELSGTSNNAYCSQSTTQCQGVKLGTRDAFGNCNNACGCVPDNFNYQCTKGQCGATCAVNADCDDGNVHTTDVCDTTNCSCKHEEQPYCGNGIINVGETCELPGTSNNAYCGQTNTTCSGSKLGIRDLFGNCDAACGCAQDDFTYSCVKNECGATCSANSDCADYCEGDIRHFSKACDLTNSCSCTEGQSFNCSSLDGWYDTNDTQWISTGACTEKQQKKQEYKDYSCSANTAVDCTSTITDSKWINTTNIRNKDNGTTCDDGLFCTDNDVCTAGQCGGTSKSCSGFNISGIETCDNNPDANHFTWDFRHYFTSVCDEGADKCTEGSFNITHTCDKENCGAQCASDSDCNDQNAFTTDVCLANCSCEHTNIPHCGDGIINLPGEECDDGNNLNGDRCSADCKFEPCYNVTLHLNYSHLEPYCGPNPSLNVTAKALFSDDVYARQDTCTGTKQDVAYIYMYWYNVTTINLTEATAFIEQKDSQVLVWLEYYNGTKWAYACDITENTVDTINACTLALNNNLQDIALRMGVERVNVGYADLDMAYMHLRYCDLPPEPVILLQSTVTSGGSGSRRSGGGGGGGVSVSTWTCSEWTVCADGKQERTCTQSSVSKTEVQDCQAVVSNSNANTAGTVSLTIEPSGASDDSASLPVETTTAASNENAAANSGIAQSNDNAVANVLEMNSMTGSVVGNNPSSKIVFTGVAFLVLGGLLLLFAFARK